MEKRVPVYGLDIIRLVGALLVVFYHFGFKAWAVADNPLLIATGRQAELPAWSALTWWGWVGVQVFFVVSGAVIAYSSQGTTAVKFAKRRFARLFPALLICTSLALPVAILVLGMEPAIAAKLWLKTIAFAPTGPWLLGQFWTIPIEIGFYALVCGLIGLKQCRLEPLAWVLGAASGAYWVADALGFLSAGGRWPALILLHHGVFFALGILAALKFRPRHLPLILLSTAGAALQIRTAAAWELPGAPGITDQWIVPFAVWAVITAMVYLSFMHKERIATVAQPAGDGLRLIGLMTYPLYLIHIHAGAPMLIALATFDPLLATLAATATAIGAAYIVAKLLEPPLHDTISGLLRVNKPLPAIA